jgi:hypothetical protein
MRLLLIAIAAAGALIAGLQWYASTTTVSASFAFDEAAFAETPPDVQKALGSPFTADEIDTIRRIAREEVDRAFAGLDIRFTNAGPAFWRVRVVASVKTHFQAGRTAQNAAGASYVFGMLGGGAFINMTTLALKAVVYAPPGASRYDIVQAIGRGIGRSAVHEFAHLIAGSESIHSDDENSYEYHAADRASQYFGELKWSSARRLLERRLGR